MKQSHYNIFYEIIKNIPYGSILTYGEVAALAGLPKHARQVGYALAKLHNNNSHDIPWHRVVNAQYKISTRGRIDGESHQRLLLESEGLKFDTQGKIIINKQ